MQTPKKNHQIVDQAKQINKLKIIQVYSKVVTPQLVARKFFLRVSFLIKIMKNQNLMPEGKICKINRAQV